MHGPSPNGKWRGQPATTLPGFETKFNKIALARPPPFSCSEAHLSSDIWIIVAFALGTGLLALATPLAVETLVNTVAFGRLLQPVIVLALIAFVILVLGRGAVASSIKESKTKYRMAAWLEDLMGCPTAFRHSGAAEFALERADQLTHDYLSARKAHFRVVMRQIVFALGMQAFASTVLLGLGGWLVISGQLTLGQLVAAELIVTVIVGSFAKLGKYMESYYDLLAACEKLHLAQPTVSGQLNKLEK